MLTQNSLDHNLLNAIENFIAECQYIDNNPVFVQSIAYAKEKESCFTVLYEANYKYRHKILDNNGGKIVFAHKNQHVSATLQNHKSHLTDNG